VYNYCVELEKEKIKELEREIAKLRSEIRTDGLTRVLNRRGIEEEFVPLFEDAKHTRDHGVRRKLSFDDVSVLFIDLDNFKKINDAYGHEVGDTVLVSVAAVLGRSIRGIDRVGRWGGEEFVVMLPGASEEDAFEKAKILLKSIQAISSGSGSPTNVSASIGVASISQANPETVEQLIDMADRAMYEAKHNRGKGTVVCASEL